MANIYESMNVRQKLAKARLYFLNQKVKKSGKNMHLLALFDSLDEAAQAEALAAALKIISGEIH